MIKDRIFLLFLLIVAVFILWNYEGSSQVRVYDCGMAEWHPDIPKEVKEECRRIHYEDWEKQQQDKKAIHT